MVHPMIWVHLLTRRLTRSVDARGKNFGEIFMGYAWDLNKQQ